MGQSAETKLTPQVSQEICQRNGGTAVLIGSITQIGPQYNLILKAVNCSNGESLTSSEATANDKSQVLAALGKASSAIRNKLGESLGSIQRSDIPLERASTPSLEALQAYSRAASLKKGDRAAAVPLLQRAIQLDPNFALAYARLGTIYWNLSSKSLATENLRKAFDLRDRVSEQEKLEIESSYYLRVVGNTRKAQQSLEVWEQTYPNDFRARADLGTAYARLGQYEKSLAEFQEALRLDPERSALEGPVVASYRRLNRVDQARTLAEEALAQAPDSHYLHGELYLIAFIQNDAQGMARQVAWSQGKPGEEGWFLQAEADRAAYFGQLTKARELSRRAVASYQREKQQDAAANCEAETAFNEALFGNGPEARQLATSALHFSTDRDVQYLVAVALALTGDAVRATALTADLDERFPEESIVQFNYLPTLHALLAMGRREPSSAIESLQVAEPYDLGIVGAADLYPAFVRGETYLAMHKGSNAVMEFQKVIDNRAIVNFQPIGALAHLQLGRAYALQGESAKAQAAYQQFLTLWNNADSNLPILLAAKSEAAQLH
jgi:tetratricopeptide (TPR) repeat protein